MFVHAIACSLPDGHSYFTFHAHVDPSKCTWREEDQERYFKLLDLIERMYTSRDLAEFSMDPTEAARFRNRDISLDEALQRVVPYYVTADRVTKNTDYLETKRDQVNRVREAGIGEDAGVDFYVLVKNETAFHPKKELITRVFRSEVRKGRDIRARDKSGNLLPLESWDTGMELLIDGTPISFDDIAFRRYPMLVNVVRAKPQDELIERGSLKIVAVPNDIELDLVRNRGGEMLRERARTWS